MEITVEIPEEFAAWASDPATFGRRLIEAFAADGYWNGRFSRQQVAELLGLDCRQLEEFLVAHCANRPDSKPAVPMEAPSPEPSS